MINFKFKLLYITLIFFFCYFKILKIKIYKKKVKLKSLNWLLMQNNCIINQIYEETQKEQQKRNTSLAWLGSHTKQTI